MVGGRDVLGVSKNIGFVALGGALTAVQDPAGADRISDQSSVLVKCRGMLLESVFEEGEEFSGVFAGEKKTGSCAAVTKIIHAGGELAIGASGTGLVCHKFQLSEPVSLCAEPRFGFLACK